MYVPTSRWLQYNRFSQSFQGLELQQAENFAGLLDEKLGWYMHYSLTDGYSFRQYAIV